MFHGQCSRRVNGCTTGNQMGPYVSRYLCSPVPMFPEPMFPGASRCSPVPMFPGTDVPRFVYFNSGHWYKPFANPLRYDNRLVLCLAFNI